MYRIEPEHSIVHIYCGIPTVISSDVQKMHEKCLDFWICQYCKKCRDFFPVEDFVWENSNVKPNDLPD